MSRLRTIGLLPGIVQRESAPRPNWPSLSQDEAISAWSRVATWSLACSATISARATISPDVGTFDLFFDAHLGTATTQRLINDDETQLSCDRTTGVRADAKDQGSISITAPDGTVGTNLTDSVTGNPAKLTSVGTASLFAATGHVTGRPFSVYAPAGGGAKVFYPAVNVSLDLEGYASVSYMQDVPGGNPAERISDIFVLVSSRPILDDTGNPAAGTGAVPVTIQFMGHSYSSTFYYLLDFSSNATVEAGAGDPPAYTTETQITNVAFGAFVISPLTYLPFIGADDLPLRDIHTGAALRDVLHAPVP